MKLPEYSPCILLVVLAITVVLVFGEMNIVMILASVAAFVITYSITGSYLFGTISGVITLLTVAMYIKQNEGFNGRASPSNIISAVKNMKQNSPMPGTTIEDFVGNVYKNITKAGYNNPGFGMASSLVEGFEDQEKSKKSGTPAPTEEAEVEEPSKPVAAKKDVSIKDMPQQFKLGEIPSQVKNGPHIDAGSTLMKAIEGLKPDQINAMTKDTQQLIDTQKSLMGMLGTMKPMMKDGKELMETFQQMFGQ